MKAAIIGAGFVGKELARQLLATGHEPVLLGPSPVMDADCDCIPCDVLQGEVPLPANTEAVFYLAQSPYYRDFPAHAGHLFGVNTLGPVKAAEAAAAVGCRFFFYASTGNVYTPGFDALSEQSPAKSPQPYALSKRMAEEALSLFSTAMTVVCGRIFGVYGPGQRAMLAALIRQRVLEGIPVQLAPHPERGDDGGLHVSFIYNSDLARILVALAEKAMTGESLPRILNLAGPKAVSLRELAEEIGRSAGKGVSFEIPDMPRQFDLSADISLLSRHLPTSFTPLRQALSEWRT
ncbi:NAD(P)-dependent oxidoreductase [Desulfovibrio sp. OttesenSCG-928-G11]|nr:NAD(P)-dependent oxidoreductase [Desulfovibrio sp. OttesenSCG-928-G11]